MKYKVKALNTSTVVSSIVNTVEWPVKYHTSPKNLKTVIYFVRKKSKNKPDLLQADSSVDLKIELASY